MEYGPAKQTALSEILAGKATFTLLDPRAKSEEWIDFTPPAKLPINHPWISRHSPSALLYFDNGPPGSNTISTQDRETYGDPSHPILFRIGSGSAGYTGIFQVLCEKYIETHGANFSIGMVRNNSRHTQVALLADVVQVALTQEAHNEDLAIAEGWCKRACRVFNDHFILIGPTTNPAGIQIGSTLNEALRTMMSQGSYQPYNQMLFHSNGDGSSTFFKKQQLWIGAGIDVSNPKWAKSYSISPYEALKKAAQESSYLLTDRATYLSAKHHGLIPRMRVCAEGGQDLLNPCSALLKTSVDHPSSQAAAAFADWLGGNDAQEIIRQFGKDWSYRMPLFTVAEQHEFDQDVILAGRL